MSMHKLRNKNRRIALSVSILKIMTERMYIILLITYHIKYRFELKLFYVRRKSDTRATLNEFHRTTVDYTVQLWKTDQNQIFQVAVYQFFLLGMHNISVIILLSAVSSAIIVRHNCKQVILKITSFFLQFKQHILSKMCYLTYYRLFFFFNRQNSVDLILAIISVGHSINIIQYI